MSATSKPRWFQFSLRTLLIVMTVAAMLTARIAYVRRMADYHAAETKRLQQHRMWLLTVSFHTPQVEWQRLDDMEARHSDLASQYQQATWRPWMIVHESQSPLP